MHRRTGTTPARARVWRIERDLGEGSTKSAACAWRSDRTPSINRLSRAALR
jgi:hypothetical protein